MLRCMHGYLCFLQGFPHLLVLPAQGKPGFFGKEEILCINDIHVEERGAGEGESSLICMTEVSNPIPSPGNGALQCWEVYMKYVVEF